MRIPASTPLVPIRLPLRFHILTRLRRHEGCLPPDGFCWPPTGPALLALEREPIASLDVLAHRDATVTVIETGDREEIERLARWCALARRHAIALVPAGLRLAPLDLGDAAARFAVVSCVPGEAGERRARGACATLLRRLLFETALDELREAALGPLAALADAGVVPRTPPVAPSVPLAPYDVVLNAHLLGVLGFQPRKQKKGEGWLAVGRRRLGRLRGLLPPAVPLLQAEALPPVRLAVAEPRSPETARLVAALAAVRAVRPVAFEVVTGAARTAAHLACVRHREAGPGAAATTRFELTLTPALPPECAAWMPAPVTVGHVLLAPAAAPERLAPATLEALSRALVLAGHLRDLAVCSERAVACAAELAWLPAGTGEEGLSLDAVLQRAVHAAREHAAGSEEGAARLLRIDARRVARIADGLERMAG